LISFTSALLISIGLRSFFLC